MTAEQFTYWLQGFMEINNPEILGVRETQIIKDHLKLVFDKQTPDRPVTPPLAPMPIWQEPHTTTPYTGPDWTWRPNPYTITCTGDAMNDPNKKIC
jgi:hypothetical protein